MKNSKASGWGSALSDNDLSSAVEIKKKPIRAPRRHGETLVVPAASKISQLWDQNLHTILGHDFEVNGQPIGQLRQTARSHLLATARSYCSQYRDLAVGDGGRVILSGHQPRLFHPGVWFKNFALSQLGQQLDATAINLVVDNDLCGHPSISVPQASGERGASLVAVAYDQAGGNVPFENREILDRNLFDSFGERVRAAIAPVVAKPLVEPLWEYAKQYQDRGNRLGHTLAAARHKLEADFGLQTLELPLSEFCDTETFAHFVLEILNRVDEFQQIYNRSLIEYRNVHRIRSSAHPVPALGQADDWFEVPFWIWFNESPLRRGLFVRRQGKQLTLSNRHDWELAIDGSDRLDQLTNLYAEGIRIRPRALMTTLYSRMVLSDLFIHGIGGAKYDQLTDAIITRFWNVEPPSFLTVTGTATLPFDFSTVTSADLNLEKVRLRELRFHPERFIVGGDEAVQAIIQEKGDWINRVSDGSMKQRHDAIERCNGELFPFVAEQAAEATKAHDAKRGQLARSRILGSREYSFCCFAKDRCVFPIAFA